MLVGVARDAAEVDNQLAIDEHPDVVVAREPQDLSGRGVVGEVRGDFKGKEVVMAVVAVAQQRIVDREEVAGQVLVHAVGLAINGDPIDAGHVYSGHVSEPLCEGLGRGDSAVIGRALRSFLVAAIAVVDRVADLVTAGVAPFPTDLVAAADEYGFAVIIKLDTDIAHVMAVAIGGRDLEILMPRKEVADDARHGDCVRRCILPKGTDRKNAKSEHGRDQASTADGKGSQFLVHVSGPVFVLFGRSAVLKGGSVA